MPISFRKSCFSSRESGGSSSTFAHMVRRLPVRRLPPLYKGVYLGQVTADIVLGYIGHIYDGLGGEQGQAINVFPFRPPLAPCCAPACRIQMGLYALETPLGQQLLVARTCCSFSAFSMRLSMVSHVSEYQLYIYEISISRTGSTGAVHVDYVLVLEAAPWTIASTSRIWEGTCCQDPRPGMRRAQEPLYPRTLLRWGCIFSGWYISEARQAAVRHRYPPTLGSMVQEGVIGVHAPPGLWH